MKRLGLALLRDRAHYRPTKQKRAATVAARKTLKIGAPGMIRTCDPLIRSQVLYPAELRVPLMK